MILRLIRRLLCKHQSLEFYFNIYGDHIIYSGDKRSCWRCNDCGKYVYSEKLNTEVDR